MTEGIKNSDNEKKDADRQIYYARAQDWAEDRERGFASSRRLAWLIAGFAIAVAMFEAVALVLLTPLKETIPYVMLVDRHTGYVQVLKGSDQAAIAPDAALTQSLLAQYVSAREGFDITSISSDYRKVALWSGDLARKQYIASMPATNPTSPLRRLPRTSVVRVTVKSISPLQKNVMLVRFDTERVDQGQEGGQIESWAAVIGFRYVNAPMRFEDRLINPLGFQVLHYRKDAEALTPATFSVGPRSLPGSTADSLTDRAMLPASSTNSSAVRGGEAR